MLRTLRNRYDNIVDIIEQDPFLKQQLARSIQQSGHIYTSDNHFRIDRDKTIEVFNSIEGDPKSTAQLVILADNYMNSFTPDELQAISGIESSDQYNKPLRNDIEEDMYETILFNERKERTIVQMPQQARASVYINPSRWQPLDEEFDNIILPYKGEGESGIKAYDFDSIFTYDQLNEIYDGLSVDEAREETILFNDIYTTVANRVKYILDRDYTHSRTHQEQHGVDNWITPSTKFVKQFERE